MPQEKSMMDKQENIYLIYDAVKRELLKIPGVVTVGIGLKEVDGQLTNQRAFRVYVNKKKSQSEILSEHIIPREIKGIETDVMTTFQTESLSKGTRPLVGGLHISSVIPAELGERKGTLGCIAKINGTNNKVILSNEHVLGHKVGLDPYKKVYQPKFSDSLGFICNEVGQTTDGKIENVSYNNGTLTADYYVDCAIASKNEGIEGNNTLDEIGAITGTRDISDLEIDDGLPLEVKKKGAKTGVTAGIVEEVAYDDLGVGPEIDALRQILIRPNPGYLWEEEYQVRPEDKASIVEQFSDDPHVTVTDLSDNVLKFETFTFVLGGDSGSVVIDNSSKEVIGLLHAISTRKINILKDGELERVSIPIGKGVACHIRPVLEQMNIVIPPGTTPSSGTVRLAPGATVKMEFSEDEVSLNDAINDLEAEFRDSTNGKLLIETIQGRLSEIVHLVHHRRPVKYTWHKFKGPAFVSILMRSIRDRDKPLPKEIEGITLKTLLEKMDQSLMKEGGRELNKTLAQVRELIYRLTDCPNINSMINEVKSMSLAS